MADDEWIVIPGWDKFQHYKNRTPPWIKNYTELLRKDEYLELNARRRAILHGLWITYALNNGIVRRSTANLSRTLNLCVRNYDLEALNHAGFIGFSASKPLASRDRDRDRPLNPQRTASGKPQCPECNVTLIGSLEDHLANVHNQEIA